MTAIIEVVWDDAVAKQAEYSVKQAIKRIKLHRVHTVGYLVAERDDGILVAQSLHKKERSEFMLIPWGMVVEYWQYED